MSMEVATPVVAFWKNEIQLWERTADKWLKRGRKIMKRYKDVRTPREDAVTRLNILWSNVQTRVPALYARDPKPEVERRFKDKDPVGRQVAEVLERCLDYTIQCTNPFGSVIRQAVLDYELPGRGTVWVRYVPHFHKQINPADENKPEEVVEGEEVTNEAEDAASERLKYEETMVDYVYWEDFGHTWARTWEEVRAVWRIVYLTREEGLERFGKEFKDCPLDWQPKTLKDAQVKQDNREQKKAIIYEIWDKQDRKALWVCKNHPKLLDEQDDPLKLEHFFPCPPPMFANLTSEELVPTPNFTFYQDQANEIDELSSRITAIGKALKVAGVRDSSAEGLDRLLSEGTENALVPVDGWIALKEKGGLAGVMELLPLKEIAEALGFLREQRQMMIDDVYQITGMSDIIRGLSEPNETATAQQIKGQFAVLRLSDAQREVQRFCRDVIRIMSEIIADYDIETIKKISGVKLLTQAEKAQLNAIISAAQHPMPPMQGAPGGGPPQAAPGPPMPGQPGQAPPGGGAQPPPGAGGASAPAPGVQMPGADKLSLLKEPTWEEVAALLENPVLREFRIDVETDSTIRLDEDNEREARMAFITAVSQLIGEASSVPQSMIPAAGELILFGIRGFKVARSLERVFEDAIDKLANTPPPPNPEVMKQQAQAQSDAQIAQIKAKADIQIAQAKAQADAQSDQARAQADIQVTTHKTQLETQRDQAIAEVKQRFEAERTQFETQAKKEIADKDNATKIQIAQMEHQHEMQLEGSKQAHEQKITSMTQEHEGRMAEHERQTQVGVESLKADKAKEIEGVKGKQAKEIEGVRGENAEKVAKLKPKVKADAEGEAKQKEHEPTVQAIAKLTEALKEARKPRKVVRDEKGQIVGIH
jgi:hypothetical protein